MKFVALVVITSSELEEKLQDIIKEAGAINATIFQAKGSNPTEKRGFFSLTYEGVQSVMLYILEEKKSKNVLKAINKAIELSEDKNILAFTADISQVVGLNRSMIEQFQDSIKQIYKEK